MKRVSQEGFFFALGFLVVAGCGVRRRPRVVYVHAPPPAQELASEEAEAHVDEGEVQEGEEAQEVDDTDATVVSGAPPAPLEEIVPGPPTSGYVWVGGYWHWDGAEYLWVPGHWEAVPRPGVVWVHGGWVRVGPGYRYVRGRWAPPRAHVRVYLHPRPPIVVRPGVRYQARDRRGVIRSRGPVRGRPVRARPPRGGRR